jgi:hypothetical protein
MASPNPSPTYAFIESAGTQLENIKFSTTTNFNSRQTATNGSVTTTFCACNPGWTGACCTNYQPGTLTPSVLDFGNVTVGAPDGSQPDVVLANTMANTNLTVQSISLTGTDSSDFAYTTTCAANTNVASVPGNCTFAITFTPSATGTRTAILSVHVTGDGGDNTQTLATTLTGRGITRVSSILIDPLSISTLFAGLEGAGIFKSTDSGGSWNTATLPASPNTRIKALVIAPADSSKLFAATYGSGIYRSTTSGDSWETCTDAGLTNANVLSLVTDSTGKLYAGTEDGVFASTDDCVSWTAMSTGLPS